MSDVSSTPNCDVAVLAPHASASSALLCRSTDGEGDANGITMPCVQLTAEPEITDVLLAIENLLGHPVVPLRAVALAWDANFDTTAMVVEIEPLRADVPRTLHFRSIDESGVSTISPEWVRETVRAWQEEQRSGWSELRPQWSRPGWLNHVSPWMTEQMVAAGYVAPQPPRVHYLWGVSMVLASTSKTGTAYLKCSGERFRTEGSVTEALAKRSPHLLPEVVAVDTDNGWLLMRDLGGTELGNKPDTSWSAGLTALAQLQKEWMESTDDLLSLGAEDRPLSDLIAWVEGTHGEDQLLAKMSKSEREAWTEALPEMVQSCHQLEEVGPLRTLVHGDFHPWNVVETDDQLRIFDWTDAAISHPFLDLVTYVMRSSSVEQRQSMVNNYFAEWSDVFSAGNSQELCRLALVVGSLYQAQTYTRLIPTIMPADLGELRDGDAQWLARAMRIAAEGLGASY